MKASRAMHQRADHPDDFAGLQGLRVGDCGRHQLATLLQRVSSGSSTVGKQVSLSNKNTPAGVAAAAQDSNSIVAHDAYWQTGRVRRREEAAR